MHRAARSSVAVLVLFVFASCPVWAVSGDADGRGVAEVTSALGRRLYALPDDDSLVEARRRAAADPTNVALILALSHAQAARRQYREAIETCTRGLAIAPGNADLLIERGHRELGLRQFHEAARDLEQASALDATKLDAPYHAGPAHYFLGDFPGAAKAFEQALKLAKTPDSVIDCTAWLYVSLRRAGKEAEAAEALARITPEMTNTEPHLHFYLVLLRFYQGKLAEEAIRPKRPADAKDTEAELSFNTVSYGVGNWHLYHRQPERAADLFRQVVMGEAWNSWGFIGAETELARGTGRTP